MSSLRWHLETWATCLAIIAAATGERGVGVSKTLLLDTPSLRSPWPTTYRIINTTNDWHEPTSLQEDAIFPVTSNRRMAYKRAKNIGQAPKTYFHRWNFFRHMLEFFKINVTDPEDQSLQKDIVHLKASNSEQNMQNLFQTLCEINALTKMEYLINMDDYRLPKLLSPMAYDVALRVFHWGNKTFQGEVNLTVRALDTSSFVFLHSSMLTINWSTVEISAKNSTSRHVLVDFKELPQAEMIVLVVRPPLQRHGVYSVFLEFGGHLATDEYGLYTLQYQSYGQVHTMALAQLQTKFARLVFPCLDEPAYKAKFSLRLARPTNSTAVSNTRRYTTTQLEPGWVWDHFDTTPPMSTFMFTFAIFTFDYLTVIGPGITFSVWTRPELLPYASYVLQTVPRLLYYFQDYFRVKYPLDKLDVIAVPSRYSRAVENLGMISIHEDTVQQSMSSSIQERVTTIKIIAHELAHIWFGNQVTPAWWDHIWLSEGFATFLAAKATAVVIPEGFVEGSFVAHEHWISLSEDVAPLSRAIQAPLLNNQTMLVFDEITYNKGASLVRMLEFFMGDGTFRDAISAYLKRRSFSASDNDDLLAIFDEVNRKSSFAPPPAPIPEIMHSWIAKIGYPLVIISRRPNGTTFIQQRMFSYLPLPENCTQPLFWVPVSWISQLDNTSSVEPVQLWLLPSDSVHTTELLPPSKGWVVGNPQRKAFYRVNYDRYNWVLLAHQLRHNREILSPSHRAQILDDAFHLFCAGLLEETLLNQLLSYVPNETHAVVWQVLYANANLPYKKGVHPAHFLQLREKLSRLLRV